MGSASSDEFNGLALRVWRTYRGLTTSELAEKLHQRGKAVSPAAITRWELGDRKPQDRALIRSIAKVLRCSSIALYRRPILTYRSDDRED